jgi:hypothetical protein
MFQMSQTQLGTMAPTTPTICAQKDARKMPSGLRPMIYLGLVAWLTILLFWPALADENRMRALVEARGCVIGASVVADAVAQGISPRDIGAYMAKVQSDPTTEATGDWIVLSETACKLKPPAILSKIKSTDPEVIQNISEIDTEAGNGQKRCWLDGQELVAAVQRSRGWDREKAMTEYIRFLGAGVVSGDFSFFSPSPLSTPPGFIATFGFCADRPDVLKMKESHAVLIQHFGAAVRADATGKAACEAGEAPSHEMAGIIEKLIGREPPNAWLFMEIKFISMGAGWWEGMSHREKGRPTPPLCRFR